MTRCLAWLLAASLTLSCARAAQYLGFDDYSLDWGQNGSVDMPGRLYVPTNYNPNQKYPLVIFYHGSGENGTNNTAPLDSVADSLVPKIKNRQYFMYVPQGPAGDSDKWSWNDDVLVTSMRQAAYAMANYNIDSSRVYVTGLSLGGGGTKGAMNLYTRAIAAAIPVCGTWDANFNSSPRLTNKPIWAFHGELDGPAVPVAASRNYIQSIISAGQAQGQTPPAFSVSYTNNIYNYNWANHLRYTEFKGADHFIWGRVYSESDNLGLYDWMANQSVTLSEASLRAGETAYFEIGDYPVASKVDSQGRTWNSIGGWAPIGTKTGLFPFALTSTGTATAVCVSAVSKPFASFTSAAQGYSRSGYDDDRVKDGWVTPNGTTESDPVILRITGLVPGTSYTMEAYASHVPNSWENRRWTRYRFDSVISGSTVTQYGDMDVDGNTSGTAVSLNITAGDDGAVSLKVFPAPGKNSPYAQLNTLTITRTGSSAPSNQAPVVNAGQDATTTLYDGITLSGTASDDGNPSGSSLTTTWSKDSGPGNVTFSNTAALQTTASFDMPGTYVLKLTASDTVASGTDTVTVTVNEWKNMDIGTVTVPGTSAVTSGTAIITGSGSNIWQNNDSCNFLMRPAWGDCTIIVRQVSHPYQHWSSKAGIMIRGSLGVDASLYFLGMLPGGTGSLYMRHIQGDSWSSSGQSIGVVPYWLKLVRVGNTITSSVSSDGTVWVDCESYTFASLPNTVYIGFATASATPYTLTSVFDNITVSP